MKGHAKPRVSPAAPRISGSKELELLASRLGISLFPWQREAARYLTATGPDARWLFREVAVIVARQNGKTTLLIPLIMSRLLAGQRVMHTAQNRELPREVFGQVAELVQKHYKSLLRRRPRFANGQEEIRLLNGGHYRIVAPTRGGARGPSNDLVIVDELREMVDTDFIAAAKPTLTASAKGQMVYLSNAGTRDSIVLNALRDRSALDPSLAYLEWSAAPGRAANETAGWRESNPALGHMDGILDTLRHEYQANMLAGTLGIFETEHLCRWVEGLKPTAFQMSVWLTNHLIDALAEVDPPYALGIGVAPDWQRATIAIAARRPDGRIGVEILRDFREDVTPAQVTAAISLFAQERWPAKIAFDLSSGGGSEFVRHSEESGLAYDPLKPGPVVAATMDVSEMITAGRLAVDDPLLDAQVLSVVKRNVGQDGAFRFSRSDSLGPIDAIEAMTFAAHAIAYRPRVPNIF